MLASGSGDPAIADHAASCDPCHEALSALLVTSPSSDDESTVPRVGRYELGARLGAGGMGVVYEARDPELGRAIAIKVLKRGANAERLRREAQSLAKLSHPNVVAVYDVGEHDGSVFVAMALVDGENLRSWLGKARTTDEILRVLALAARGVAAAHAAGLVHRDLKPDNIFIAHDGGVQVGDFGLARDTDEPPGLSFPGMMVGTPAYVPPEQARGEEVDARSDLFSLCVMAYEALYGVRPFSGTTLTTTIEKIERGEI